MKASNMLYNIISCLITILILLIPAVTQSMEEPYYPNAFNVTIMSTLAEDILVNIEQPKKDIFKITDQKVDDFQLSQIRCFPDQRNNFKQCTQLILTNNALTSKAIDSIFTMHQLMFLDVSHNQISEIPKPISDTLATLIIHHNQIEQLNLPEINICLPILEVLDASYNNITMLNEYALPPFAGNSISAALNLFINNNQLKTPLQKLNLAHNKIKALNLSTLLNGYEKLAELDLSNNPIATVLCSHFLPRNIHPHINLRDIPLNPSLQIALIKYSLPAPMQHLVYAVADKLFNNPHQKIYTLAFDYECEDKYYEWSDDRE